jgi:hypothetical protein
MNINPRLLQTLQSRNIALDFLKQAAPSEARQIKIRPVSNALSLTQSTNLFRYAS